MRERSTSYPPDVRAIAPAIFEIARAIIAAESSPDGVYSAETVEAPLLEATPPYLGIISSAELDATATLVLRILVAADLDRDVHRVVRRLSADPSAVGVPVDGLIAVIEGLGEDPVAALRALWPASPLITRGLIQVLDATRPPLSQQVTVPTQILEYIATGEPLPPSRPIAIEAPVAVASLCPLPVRGQAGTTAATHLRRALASLTGRVPLWLVGAPGAGRRTLLAAVADELGKRLICISHASIVGQAPGAVVAGLWRELLFGDGIVCLYDATPVIQVGSPEQAMRSVEVDQSFLALLDAVVGARLPLVFVSTQAPPVHAFDQRVQVVQLEPARREDALALWRRGLPEVAEIADLATRFRLPPGGIVRAITAARTQAAAEHGGPVTVGDVTRAISLGVEQQVSVLGNRIEDSQGWDDIVLPADTFESVREMLARVRHRHRVLDQWGFRTKLSKGLGVAALFHGPPGTGKTMVASLIARELGQELYQVDLSRMVSKWIGETEKNLAKVFDAAEGANVMLLFDEADALFSTRTAVTSSNDRHANAEVNYLLQRVERFEGVCILTTNFERSIDAAFKRRLAFRIEFPMPDEKERAELWRRMVPRSASVGNDVDYRSLAHSYELAGGNIRNALLRAAFLAADQGKSITMDILQRAVKLEYRDAGKLAATGAIS